MSGVLPEPNVKKRSPKSRIVRNYSLKLANKKFRFELVSVIYGLLSYRSNLENACVLRAVNNILINQHVVPFEPLDWITATQGECPGVGLSGKFALDIFHRLGFVAYSESLDYSNDPLKNEQGLLGILWCSSNFSHQFSVHFKEDHIIALDNSNVISAPYSKRGKFGEYLVQNAGESYMIKVFDPASPKGKEIIEKHGLNSSILFYRNDAGKRKIKNIH